MKVGISGLGFVGNAIYKCLINKGIEVVIYDKYKEGGIGSFKSLIDCDIIYIALPTYYNEKLKDYDTNAINETMDLLKKSYFKGTVLLKSTVTPGKVDSLSLEYNLNIVHNPEFLTARSAEQDFENQKHIVLGRSDNCTKNAFNLALQFYKEYFPAATISECTAKEAESMKLFLNSFYATKVQFFNEIYQLSNTIGIDYDKVKNLMLRNGWINPMHTNVPGPDGQLSYGGLCFPKDTLALLNYMQEHNTSHDVLKAVINERDKMRKDKDYIIKY